MATYRPFITRRHLLTMLSGSTALGLVQPHSALAQALTPNIGCTRMEDAIIEAKRQLATVDLWVDAHRRKQIALVMAGLPEAKRLFQMTDRELALADHDQFFHWAGLASASAVLLCVVFEASLAAALGITAVTLGAGVFLGSMFIGLGLLVWDLQTRPSPNDSSVPEYIKLSASDKLAYAFANAPKGSLGAHEKVVNNFGRYFSGIIALWNVQKVLSGGATVAEKEKAFADARAKFVGFEEDLEKLNDPATFRQATRDNLDGVIATLELLYPSACGSNTPVVPLR